MKRLISLLVVLLIVGAIGYFYYAKLQEPSDNGTWDGDCPPQGSTNQPELQQLNRLKNKANFPLETDFNREVTLAKMLAPGEDYDRWSVNTAAEVSGYVADVKVGGVETCNCKTKDHDHRDTHIELVLDAMNEGGSGKVIVEVTPRIRQAMALKGEDWSTNALRDKILGRWVKVKGWMLFDKEHERQADNTNPNGTHNWRGTCWEIHPVTSIEVIDRPI
ncbi:MAG: hypothetical protein JWO06_1059 [Bacteroidota bacterium]|nr:hypothetical protein [Bacteroidota bacterium]